MVNEFAHAGQKRGSLITWAKGIVEEAFSLQPTFMEECSIRIFGSSTWCWTADDVTDAKIHAICRAAMLVRLRVGDDY